MFNQFLGLMMLFGHMTTDAQISKVGTEIICPVYGENSIDPTPSQSISRQLLANYLDLSEEQLTLHPDFELFALANRLHRHMPYHGHQVGAGSEQELELPYLGEWMSWSEVRERVAVDDEGMMRDHLYTHKGLVPGEMGKTLPVFKVDDQHGEHYILEVVSTRGARGLRARSPHVWLRLIDKEGSVLSAGFFGESNISDTWALIRHLYPRQGRVMSPDMYEVATLPREQVTTAIRLTEEQYEMLYDYIDHVQQNDSLSYQVLDTFFGTNCAGFVGKVLKLLGVDVTGARLNLPSVITDWQGRIKQWRDEQITQLQASGELTDEVEEAILYSLP